MAELDSQNTASNIDTHSQSIYDASAGQRYYYRLVRVGLERRFERRIEFDKKTTTHVVKEHDNKK